MTMVCTESGVVLKSATPEGLVSELHALSFAPSEDDGCYMREVAQRAVMFNKTLRCDCAQHFIEDMLEIGLLCETVEKGEDENVNP